MRLRSQLGALAEYAERGTLERLGVLHPEIAELEELAAIGQASGQHAECHWGGAARRGRVRLAQREELMRLRARLSSAEAAFASVRRALETAFRAEPEASEARDSRAPGRSPSPSTTLSTGVRHDHSNGGCGGGGGGGGGVVCVEREAQEETAARAAEQLDHGQCTADDAAASAAEALSTARVRSAAAASATQ